MRVIVESKESISKFLVGNWFHI